MSKNTKKNIKMGNLLLIIIIITDNYSVLYILQLSLTCTTMRALRE